MSPNDHALRTVDLAGTLEHTDLLFVFPAPCTRCNIYLREIWIPLARDPLCAAEIHFHTHLGFWAANGTSADYYDRSTFTPSTWANGVHTVMTLGTQLSHDGIFMGSFDHKARIDIPYYGNGSYTWIGIHVTTSSCVRLGTGLDQSSQSLCVESPITPTALFVGADAPSNSTADTAGHHLWLNTGFVPGIFAPVIKIEPWLPICIPLLPTPSPRPSVVPTRAPGASPSPTAPRGSPSPTAPGSSPSPTAPRGSPSASPSKHSSQSKKPTKSHGGGANDDDENGDYDKLGGSSTDNSGTSGGLMASIGAGGIAGIVIAAVAGAILVAAAVVVVVSKRSAAAASAASSSSSTSAASAADSAASSSAQQQVTGEAPARSPAGNPNSNRPPSATSP